MEKWRNKIAVITGASSGIGLAILKDLLKNGIIVIGLARNIESIEDLKNNLGENKDRVYSHKCDISNAESLKESFEWIEKEFTVIHILINNAGVLHNLSILDSSDETTEKINNVIDTNFTGAVHCARKALHLIIKSDDFGMIVNVNSIAGHSVYNGLHVSNVYSPTKFALTAFSEILRQELVNIKNDKIRISNLSPGVVKTEIMVRGKIFESQDTYDGIPHILSTDISQGVLYLLSTPYNVNVTQLTIKPLGEKK